MNYHWIDSNYDGKIDIMVFNDIDMAGEYPPGQKIKMTTRELKNMTLEKYPDDGITAWIYDTTFTGKDDKAEYLGKGFQKTIEEKDGFFIFNQAMLGEKKIPASQKDFFQFYNKLLSDINSMLP